jgi:hypothetical protein
MTHHNNQIPNVIRTRRRRRRRRNARRGGGGIQPYRLKEFFFAYLIAIAVNVVGFVGLSILFIPFYFITGVVLSRFISRRVIWNPYLASVADIASAKMHTWVTWPISVPVLIWQVLVAHHG